MTSIKSEQVKISTITMTTKLPECALNLTNIGKYLDIDETIVGIKYNYANLSVTKGKYSTTIYKKSKLKNESKINKVLFYNQVSIIVNNNGNHVNVKLFNNGSLHLTGCKMIDEGDAITRLLYNKLNGLKDKKDLLLLTMDKNGIFTDRDNLVYSHTTRQIIGHFSDNTYFIHKKEYDVDINTGMFISKKIETGRKKPMLNLDGEPIGYWQIELLQNKTKLYKKNSNVFYDFSNGFIYHNNKTIIGKFVYHIDIDKVTQKDSSCEIIEINYICNPFIDENYTIENKQIITDINCINVYFKLPFDINRQRLYEQFIEMEYICKYKPESYSGVKLIYKLPTIQSDESIQSDKSRQSNETLIDGYCRCSSKCTCRNITFLIFQTGNIIATGFKTQREIDMCCQHFIEICNNHKTYIQKKMIATMSNVSSTHSTYEHGILHPIN